MSRGQNDKLEIFTIRKEDRDFPGGPVIKTLPSNTGDAGSIPGCGMKIPHSSWPKNQSINRSNIVSDSIKTLKMVHIKKIYFKKKKERRMGRRKRKG